MYFRMSRSFCIQSHSIKLSAGGKPGICETERLCFRFPSGLKLHIFAFVQQKSIVQTRQIRKQLVISCLSVSVQENTDGR